MKLPESIRKLLHRWAVRYQAGREPDLVIVNRSTGKPYLTRWHLLPRNPLLNVFLHHITDDDEGRALHDHPWWNCSIILAGGYMERQFVAPTFVRLGFTQTFATFRGHGSVLVRSATTAHRLETRGFTAWTLFITGPRYREWGFIPDHGTWIHHDAYAHHEDGIAMVREGM